MASESDEQAGGALGGAGGGAGAPGAGAGGGNGERGLPDPTPPPDSIVDYVYRIFCAKDEMPPLEKLLARLTSGNPKNPPGSFIFPPGKGMRRLQDALGASRDYFVMGYSREEAPDLWKELDAAIAAGWAPGFGDDDRLCARDSKLCVVLRAQIKNPQNNEFVETLVHLADAFRDLLFGIVHDVKMERVFGNREWREEVMGEPFSVLNHVSVRSLPAGPGEPGKRVATRGLQKFGNADLVALSVPADLEKDVAFMLRDFAEHITQGDLIGADEAIEYDIGRVRLAAIPPLEAGGNDACAIVDDVEGDDRTSPDPKRGAPRIYAALRAKRESIEGRRAGGGKGAQ